MAGAKIDYGFRREGIHYEFDGKVVDIDFTWCNGDRIYTDSIDRWNDDETISDKDKRKVLSDVLRFTNEVRRAIVVVSTDDPSQKLWEEVCRELSSLVQGIEYTSDQKQRHFEREMYLGTLRRGLGLNINGVEIRTEDELDQVLTKLTKRSRSD
ncbi:MAG: hypothetical protein DMF63_05025 [Acidobacteria bacterium]|nr:MAG: hypothetical protein DMF63_05025 [Acidobacteriota bacterium]